MAIVSPQQNTVTPIADNASDYGSDIDDATVDDLLSQAESQPLKDVVLESIEEEPNFKDDAVQHRNNLRLPRLRQSVDSVNKSSAKLERAVSNRQVREASVEVEYDEGNRNSFCPSNPAEKQDSQDAITESVNKDTRSPLERFRKSPKKPMSVTDLVSPAWCEQQYEYSLTKHGRVRRTPAMKQGSSVHKVLEKQVHTDVPVEVVTKEDRFGLRIWNAIQGLRTLRETGLTRELEIFGILEGEVIIGVIDEITITCPDEQMEAAILDELKTPKTGGTRPKSQKNGQLLEGQRTLTDFLTSSPNGSLLENNPTFLGTLQQEKPLTHYLKDIKTRQSRSLPSYGSPSRPTHLQLMLYHVILSALASNEVPAEQLFERYRLHASQTFSDKFIAEIANLDIASYASTNPDEQSDSLTELLEHNTLSSLWTLLISEYAKTFPIRPGHSSISPLLTAEFRTASSRQTAQGEHEAAGTVIGQRSFPFDATTIDKYIRSEMAWWKGERETVGVEVEEAYKCRMCEFSEECTWRATKIEEGLKKAKLRNEKRRKSEV